MIDFDPTTNRIPFRLLTTEEQAILKAWPHGWQVSGGDGDWVDMRHHPIWAIYLVYRGKPAPAKVAYEDETALYDVNRVYTPAAVQHLLGNRPTWKEWREILAAGYEQKARADRLEAAQAKALNVINNILLTCYPDDHDSSDALRDARRLIHELKGEQQ